MINSKSQSKAVKAILGQPLLLVNSIIEGVLGIWMILAPSTIQTIGSVEIPAKLIQTCGLLALSVAFFSKIGAIYISKSKDQESMKAFIYCCLAVFNSALAIGLFYFATSGDINYLGTIIHLPLALVFIYAWIKIPKQRSAQ